MSTQKEPNNCNAYPTPKANYVNYELNEYKHVEVMQIQDLKIPNCSEK